MNDPQSHLPACSREVVAGEAAGAAPDQQQGDHPDHGADPDGAPCGLAGVAGGATGVNTGDITQLAQLGTILSLFRYSRVMEAEADAPDAQGLAECAAFLRKVIAGIGEERFAQPLDYGNASWVSFRLLRRAHLRVGRSGSRRGC